MKLSPRNKHIKVSVLKEYGLAGQASKLLFTEDPNKGVVNFAEVDEDYFSDTFSVYEGNVVMFKYGVVFVENGVPKALIKEDDILGVVEA